MTRAVSITASVAFVAALAIFQFASDQAALGVVLLLISLLIGAALGVRRGYLKVREVAGHAQAFVTGRVQHARIVEVGEPEGFFNPTSRLVLELEGESGPIHRFDREVPVPFPFALSRRLSRRFRVPFLGNQDLSEYMAFELRREGLDIDLDWRPPPGAEIVDGPATATSP